MGNFLFGGWFLKLLVVFFIFSVLVCRFCCFFGREFYGACWGVSFSCSGIFVRFFEMYLLGGFRDVL